jgi:O-antigen ligase
VLAKLVPFIPLLLIIGFLSIRYWRPMVPIILLYALIEGGIRKWGFPAYQAQIYLIKDVILIFVFIGWAIDRRKDWPNPPPLYTFKYLLALLCGFLLIQFANPNAPSVILSIVGFKNYLNYVPLMVVIPHILDTRAKLQSFLIFFAFVSIFIDGLGLYQFTQPFDAPINKTLSHEEGVTVGASTYGNDLEGNFVRTSSTFSFLGSFVTYLTIVIPFLIALIFARGIKGWRMFIVYLALVVAVGATFTTGSRTSVLIVLISVPFIYLMATLRGLISPTAFFRLLVVSAAFAVLASVIFEDSITGLLYRAENSDSNLLRLLSPINETLDAFRTTPIFGFGLGTNANAATTIMGTSYFYWLDGNFFEVEPARILQEIGLIGFILIYALRIYLVVMAFRYAFKHSDPLYIGICLSCAVFFMVHIPLFIVNNPTAGLYYWAMAGMMLATGRMARKDYANANGLNEWMQPTLAPAQRFGTPATA